MRPSWGSSWNISNALAATVLERNNRLAALHAFFRYVAVSEPGLSLHCQRILAMPSKRYDRGPVAFLTEEETAALVAAPNPVTWIGKRDRVLLLVAVQTGLRNSEITSLRRQDVELGTGAHVRCLGKGRKMRCTPLRPDVVKILREWMSQQGGKPEDPVFPSSNGGRLSADALQQLVANAYERSEEVITRIHIFAAYDPTLRGCPTGGPRTCLIAW
jgi:site-specific recombinase XerD